MGTFMCPPRGMTAACCPEYRSRAPAARVTQSCLRHGANSRQLGPGFWCLSYRVFSHCSLDSGPAQCPPPNHRTTEGFGLRGPSKGHLVQAPCHQQGHLQPDQVAQSPVQPGLEWFQGWGISHLHGQPGPVPHHPQRKPFLPSISSESPLLQFKAIPPCPIATGPAKNSVPSFLTSSFYRLKGRDKVSPEPSLLQAEQPQLSQPVITAEVLQPSAHFGGLLWPHSNGSVSFLR